MKNLYFSICIWLLSSCYVNAQINEPVNTKKDKVDYQGYSIRLLPAVGGTYGYNILKGKELIVHQAYNPFTMSPIGLRKKNDVYKVAKWQINQLKGQKLLQKKSTPDAGVMSHSPAFHVHSTAIINQPIPKSVAAALRISAQ